MNSTSHLKLEDGGVIYQVLSLYLFPSLCPIPIFQLNVPLKSSMQHLVASKHTVYRPAILDTYILVVVLEGDLRVSPREGVGGSVIPGDIINPVGSVVVSKEIEAAVEQSKSSYTEVLLKPMHHFQA